MHTLRTAHILLVDDDPNHRFLIRRLLSRTEARIEVTELEDGQQTLDYVYGRRDYSDRGKYPYPDLILLDIKMPGVDGLKVLQVLKRDKQTQHVPIVILTTSSLEEEIAESYRQGANAFVTKPTGFEDFAKAMGSVVDFWVSAAKLPPRGLEAEERRETEPSPEPDLSLRIDTPLRGRTDRSGTPRKSKGRGRRPPIDPGRMPDPG
jgi:CheY-like chemotaxis protein